jgi:hypothetical protein
MENSKFKIQNAKLFGGIKDPKDFKDLRDPIKFPL